MVVGRKPTPAALRVLQGNPGRRPYNTREPEVVSSQPDPPDCLTLGALRIWHDVAPKLAAAKILAALDAATLASYCVAWDEFETATAHIATHGLMIETAAGLKISPFVTLRHRVLPHLLRLSAALGLTPSARSRITTAEPSTESSKWDGILP